jgi:MEMO1 family protein
LGVSAMQIDRQPAVAGLFYPANPASLRRQVESLMAGARTARQPGTAPESRTPAEPKALVVPHAGYQYSGPVAASAYARIAPIAARIRRVVLLGPAHRIALRGIAYPSADRLLTPLGAVTVDRESLALLADLHQVRQLDGAFDGEHCLEVQLPFLQTLLPDFRAVPLLVGHVEPSAVAQVIDRLWGGAETLVLVSSDLSHFLDYDSAVRVDRATTQAIEHLDAESLDRDSACGATVLAGLLLEARRRALAATTLDLRSSGDTAGMRERVVGYGAYVFG